VQKEREHSYKSFQNIIQERTLKEGKHCLQNASTTFLHDVYRRSGAFIRQILCTRAVSAYRNSLLTTKQCMTQLQLYSL